MDINTIFGEADEVSLSLNQDEADMQFHQEICRILQTQPCMFGYVQHTQQEELLCKHSNFTHF